MRLSASAVVTAVVLALAAPAFAQESREPEDDYEDFLGLGTKQLQIRGGMRVETWFDDNILLTKNNEEDDIITVLAPSLNLRFDRNESWVSLDYRGRDRLFNSNSQLNGMEHYLDGVVHLKMGNLWIEATDNYEYRLDPFNTLQIVDKLKTLQNDAWLAAGLDWDRLDIEARVGLRRFEIFDPTFDVYDHRRLEGSGLVAIDLWTKTQGLVEVGFSDTTYDQDDTLDNFTTLWVVGGIRGEPTAKIRTTAKAGLVRVDNDDTGIVVSDDHSGPFVSIALDWEATTNGVLKLEAQLKPVESIFTGVAIVTRFDAGYHHYFSERTKAHVTFYFETQEEVEGGEDREALGVSGGFSHDVSRHFFIEAWGEFRTKESDNDTFEYDNVRGFAGAGIKW